MNDKPVAWIIDIKMTDGEDNFIWNTGDYPDWQVKDWIPLYTHPVKELTDEEITRVFDECYPNNGDGDVVTLIDFARAILRKASEK